VIFIIVCIIWNIKKVFLSYGVRVQGDFWASFREKSASDEARNTVHTVHLVSISNFVVLCKDGFSSKRLNDTSFQCIKKLLPFSVTNLLRSNGRTGYSYPKLRLYLAEMSGFSRDSVKLRKL
jgi:hypothetical protein